MSESVNYISSEKSEANEIKSETVISTQAPGDRGDSNVTLGQRESPKISTSHHITSMPVVVASQAPLSAASSVQSSQASETVFKAERSESAELVTESAECVKSRFDSDSSLHEHAGFMGEEPLEIQCGENAALLYVSKLCQGSKGPCILFNNEWLTPNELQYISGRETAKDWKRSIRYKGKSLKSLIARGLIKVHPPICDCLGCRISSPVNRGRLASKCGIPPTSPRSRKRDAVKSLSCWSHEELADSATGHRHYSTSDIECLARQAASNGLHFKERRDSSSSTTSDGSETQEENPFSPVKRARSASPEADEKHQIYKRRTSDSTPLAFFPSNPGGEGLHGYDTRAISMHREINARYLMTGDRGLHSQEGPVDPKDKGPRGEDKGTPRAEGSSEARSAFRAVHQDVAMSEVTNEALQRDMAIRAAKLHKQPPPSPGRNPAQYLPTFSHPMGATSLISPTHSSPRLPPDPLLLAGHPSGIYHPALRGVGYASMHQLQQNLMQYRLLAPPGTHNPTQSPLAGLALQNKLYMHDTGAMAANTTSSAQAQRQHENGLSPKRRRLSAESSESGRRQSIAISDETNEKRECEQMNGDRTNHVSVIHRSPNHSPISIDEPAESTSSASAKDRVSPHKLIPKLRLDLDQDILAWGVDDVCKFILSLTGVPEVVAEFREHSIDGQSLILLQEEHLLNRMGIKLGPALKIKAHIRKILEKLQSSQENNDSTEST